MSRRGAVCRLDGRCISWVQACVRAEVLQTSTRDSQGAACDAGATSLGPQTCCAGMQTRCAASSAAGRRPWTRCWTSRGGRRPPSGCPAAPSSRCGVQTCGSAASGAAPSNAAPAAGAAKVSRLLAAPTACGAGLQVWGRTAAYQLPATVLCVHSAGRPRQGNWAGRAPPACQRRPPAQRGEGLSAPQAARWREPPDRCRPRWSCIRRCARMQQKRASWHRPAHALGLACSCCVVRAVRLLLQGSSGPGSALNCCMCLRQAALGHAQA